MGSVISNPEIQTGKKGAFAYFDVVTHSFEERDGQLWKASDEHNGNELRFNLVVTFFLYLQ